MENNLISTHVNGYFAGNYSSIESVPANKTVCEIFYDGKYPDSFFDGEKWVENLPTAEEISKLQKEELLNSIKEKYEFHKANGWDTYQSFRAKIVSDVYTGRITEVQAFTIERYLKIAYDRISQNGDWKTARYELSQVTGFPDYVKYYYDLALNFISNYILQNYED